MNELNEIGSKNKKEVKNELIKYLVSANNQHLFNINRTNVKVVFSTKNDASDIESALVKIASQRGT